MRFAVGLAGALPHAPAPGAPEPAGPGTARAAVEPSSPPADGPPVQDAPVGVLPEPPPPAPASPFEPAPDARAPEGAPPSPPRRGGLSAWLRRPAEYLRAYLTASLEHQLHQQARRTVDAGGALARLEHRAAHAEAAAAHSRAEVGARLDQIEAQLRTEAQARTAQAGVQAAALAEVALQLRAALGRLEGLDRLAAALARTESRGDDQLALAQRAAAVGDHAVRRLDEVLAVLGPRFDELDIKVRPLIEVDGESAAVRTADAYIMLPRSEPAFLTAVANAASGGLEPGVRGVLRALLRPGDACADVGANVGLLTVAMAFAVGPAGRVWAFEPEARVRAQLERTLQLNGLRQVSLSGAAVGAAPGRLVFHQSPIIGHSSLYALPADEEAQARPVEVEVVRLDDVVPVGRALAAVKIDVEGAELDVLAGMSRVLADSPDLAVVAEFGPSHLARVGQAPEGWFAAFAAHGLEPRRIVEPAGTVAPVTAAEAAHEESVNLVFVRPGGPADGRLPR